MSIYRKKKIVKAASGLDTGQINAIDEGIIVGANAIPVYGQAISAALKIGKVAGEAISGDGTNTVRNIVGDTVNPFSTLNALASGNVKEAIPVLGSFAKSRRMKEEKRKLQEKKENAALNRLTAESNAVSNTLTYEDGGEIPDIDLNDQAVQDRAVVLGGSLHEDGGNPIIDANTGEKIAETETEELLLTKEQTDNIERHVAMYDNTMDKEHLLEIGKIIKNIVENEMIDYSGKYKNDLP